MILASIMAGAFNGSESVRVNCALADGTVIVLYRGEYLIGQGVLAGGSVLIAVAPLATDDIIQASVSERGNQASLPTLVLDSADRLTGWRIPQTVVIPDTSGNPQTVTAAQYETMFGIRPAASYDPSLLVGVLTPDPEPVVTTPVSVAGILFDVRIEQAVGSTTVTISNVLNQQGNALVRWASTETFGNAMARSFTQSATVTIDVKGEGDITPVSRTVSVTVFSPSVATPSSSDIIAASYRILGAGDYVRVNVNSLKACECRLEGYDASWQACIFYGADYQEASFYPAPPGAYTVWVRVAGDDTASRWKSIPVKTN